MFIFLSFRCLSFPNGLYTEKKKEEGWRRNRTEFGSFSNLICRNRRGRKKNVNLTLFTFLTQSARFSIVSSFALKIVYYLFTINCKLYNEKYQSSYKKYYLCSFIKKNIIFVITCKTYSHLFKKLVNLISNIRFVNNFESYRGISFNIF